MTDFLFCCNLMQGEKKPTRAPARKGGLLEELLSQPNTYQKSQLPPGCCAATTAIVGRAEHRKSPLLEAQAFKQNWEKSRWDQLQMKETALFAHPSKGQTGTEQSHSPKAQGKEPPPQQGH